MNLTDGPSPRSTAGLPARASGRRLLRLRRAALAVAAVVTVALGLGVRFLADGAWTGPAGDVLYAVLIYLLVSWCVPRRAPLTVLGVAVALCWLIELFQLTGLPLAMAEVWWPARLVFGTGFSGVDPVAYAAGCATAGVGDAVLTRWIRQRW